MCRQAVIYDKNDNAFYVIGGAKGGKHDPSTGIINRLDADSYEWTWTGSLEYVRRAHGVAYDGTNYLVIGGRDTHKTETCTIKGKCG